MPIFWGGKRCPPPIAAQGKRKAAATKAGLGGQTAVLGAVEEEGKAFVGGNGFDFAEEDGVVAGEMFRDEVTREMGQRIFQQGNAAGCPAKADTKLAIRVGSLIGLREMLGERLLVFAKDANTEATLRFQEGEQAGILIHANEDQWRIQGNRGEGIGGHAVDFAGSAFDGDDRDAGGKSAGHAAEHFWV
jgi:hypothetical protein